MMCYKPIDGWYSREVNPSGKRSIVFDRNQAYDTGHQLQVPCGKCIGCRLERSRQWAIRCMHEASLYEDNCFITLTYNDDHLPSNGSLDKTHFQKFLKRLRKSIYPQKLRYYHCGEYGDEGGRPHYHAIIFGWSPSDKVLISTEDKQGITCHRYLSESLTQIWGKRNYRSWRCDFRISCICS